MEPISRMRPTATIRIPHTAPNTSNSPPSVWKKVAGRAERLAGFPSTRGQELARTSISADACATGTAGLRRASTCHCRAISSCTQSTPGRTSVWTAEGIHRSGIRGGAPVPANLSGAIPMMCRVAPRTWMDLVRTSGSASSFFVQKSWLTIATARSSGRKPRPSAGEMPSALK
jgi:hypothetical protein